MIRIAVYGAVLLSLGCGRIGFSLSEGDGGDAGRTDSRVGDTGADAATDGAVDGSVEAAVDAARPLRVVSITPRYAPAAGGPITVVLAGDSGDTTAASIRIDGRPCDVETAIDGTSFDCDAPAHAPGTVSVTATSPRGPSVGGLDFTYLRPGMQQTGGPSDDRSSGIATDAAGAIYVSGATNGNLGAAPAGDFDALLVKYAADGTRVWARQLGTPSFDYLRDVAVGATGEITVAGYSAGDLDGDGMTAGGEDVFVARYRADGTLRWSTQFGSPANDEAWDLAVDAAGATYVALRTFGDLDGTNAGDEDFGLARLDDDGSVDWIRQGGTALQDTARSVAVRGDGVSFLVGYTEGNLGGTNAGGLDLFVARYEPDGTQSWLRQRGSAANDEAYDAIADDLGHIWVVGRTLGDLDGAGSAGGSDIFVMRYGLDGTHDFTRAYGSPAGDVTFGVAAGRSGHIYVGGTCGGAMHGEAAIGGADVCLVSFDQGGTRRWTRTVGSTATDSASSCAVDLLYTGLVYVSFVTEGDIDGAGARGMNDIAFARFTTDGVGL